MTYETSVIRYQDDITCVKELLDSRDNHITVQKYSHTLYGVYVDNVLITTTPYKRGAVVVKEILDHLRKE